MEFKYTRFDQQLVFNRTIFKTGFDFHEALFDTKNVVFSDVTFQGEAKHKATYQLIKYILDQKANFIEANYYFAREMKIHRLESFSKNKWDWFLLAIGKVLSDYGNSWILPLFWTAVSSIGIFFYMYLNELTALNFFSWIGLLSLYVGTLTHLLADFLVPTGEMILFPFSFSLEIIKGVRGFSLLIL